MMRLLITAGSSYLGQHLLPLAHAAGHEVRYTWFTRDPLALAGGAYCDLRRPDVLAALAADFRPQAIIHLGASNRTPDMHTVIVAGAQAAADAAAACRARLIHISTDVIFDGTAAPYDESALPTPIHAYGRAKAQAEQIVAAWPDHLIVRTSLIYSLRLIDAGTAWMRDALARGERLTLFSDHWRNPVQADDLSAACLALAGMAYRGVLNVAGADALTRADYGRRLLRYWGIAAAGAVDRADDSGRFPKDCRLAIDRAQALLPLPLRGVNALLPPVAP